MAPYRPTAARSNARIAKPDQDACDPLKLTEGTRDVHTERLHRVHANARRELEQRAPHRLCETRRIGRSVQKHGHERTRVRCTEAAIEMGLRRLADRTNRRVADDANDEGRLRIVASDHEALANSRSVWPESARKGFGDDRRV